MAFSETFRFLDLPHEIRLMTYDFVFGDVQVIVDLPLNDGGRFYHCPRVLPQILCASKKIRSEALPIFARNVEPIFCNVARREICPIPTYYLQHFRRITVVDDATEVPPVEHIPQLRELVLQDRTVFGTHSIFRARVSNMEAAAREFTKTLSDFCWCVEEKAKMKPDLNLLLDITVQTEQGKKPMDWMLNWKTGQVISQRPSTRNDD